MCLWFSAHTCMLKWKKKNKLCRIARTQCCVGTAPWDNNNVIRSHKKVEPCIFYLTAFQANKLSSICPSMHPSTHPPIHTLQNLYLFPQLSNDFHSLMVLYELMSLHRACFVKLSRTWVSAWLGSYFVDFFCKKVCN